MSITNGRNLAELASLINSDGKITAEAFSTELAASINPTVYDSASDIPFEDAVKGTQVFVPSEGLLIKLTDSDWYSIDGSTGAAAAPAAWVFQGSVSGYTAGGAWPVKNQIDKFPFAADGNATDVGDLLNAKYGGSGSSSDVSGYSAAGFTSVNINVIEKFPFATDGNSTDVGDVTVDRRHGAGQSSQVSGYTSGGRLDVTPPALSHVNTIDKFPFAVDGNATDVGDLTIITEGAAGQSSDVSGYTSGGYNYSLIINNVIEKFPFAADAGATDVGDLTAGRRSVAGYSSDVSGYISGGVGATVTNVIEKFPFATDGNSTDVGDLISTVYGAAGTSSIASGYTAGGYTPTNNIIQKFSFTADGNATDVGDLTVARSTVGTVGSQV